MFAGNYVVCYPMLYNTNFSKPEKAIKENCEKTLTGHNMDDRRSVNSR